MSPKESRYFYCRLWHPWLRKSYSIFTVDWTSLIGSHSIFFYCRLKFLCLKRSHCTFTASIEPADQAWGQSVVWVRAADRVSGPSQILAQRDCTGLSETFIHSNLYLLSWWLPLPTVQMARITVSISQDLRFQKWMLLYRQRQLICDSTMFRKPSESSSTDGDLKTKVRKHVI